MNVRGDSRNGGEVRSRPAASGACRVAERDPPPPTRARLRARTSATTRPSREAERAKQWDLAEPLIDRHGQQDGDEQHCKREVSQSCRRRRDVTKVRESHPPCSKRRSSPPRCSNTCSSGGGFATSVTANEGPAVSCDATIRMTSHLTGLITSRTPPASGARSTSVFPFGVSNGNCATPITAKATGGSAWSSFAHEGLSVTRVPGSESPRAAVFSFTPTIFAPVPMSRPRRMVREYTAGMTRESPRGPPVTMRRWRSEVRWPTALREACPRDTCGSSKKKIGGSHPKVEPVVEPSDMTRPVREAACRTTSTPTATPRTASDTAGERDFATQIASPGQLEGAAPQQRPRRSPYAEWDRNREALAATSGVTSRRSAPCCTATERSG